MSGKNVNFDDKDLKSDFYENKKVVKIDDFDVNKILVSKEEPYSTKNSLKYLTGYNDNDVVRPLCLKLAQMAGYAKKSEFNLTMSFKIRDKQLLKKYDQIWKRIEKLLKKNLTANLFMVMMKNKKIKIKKYGDSVITNFHNKNIPKEKAPCKRFLNNNVRFCYRSKEKVLYSNTFGRMQI